MPLSHFTRAILLLACSSLFLSGCSISYSLGKSSDSITASSKSSSGNGEKETKPEETSSLFMEDVSAATVLFVSQEKNDAEFQDNITSIAKSHGINDWEGDGKTFTAMGKGLKRAGVSKNNISKLSYFDSLSYKQNYKYVLEGFEE